MRLAEAKDASVLHTKSWLVNFIDEYLAGKGVGVGKEQVSISGRICMSTKAGLLINEEKRLGNEFLDILNNTFLGISKLVQF